MFLSLYTRLYECQRKVETSPFGQSENQYFFKVPLKNFFNSIPYADTYPPRVASGSDFSNLGCRPTREGVGLEERLTGFFFWQCN